MRRAGGARAVALRRLLIVACALLACGCEEVPSPRSLVDGSIAGGWVLIEGSCEGNHVFPARLAFDVRHQTRPFVASDPVSLAPGEILRGELAVEQRRHEFELIIERGFQVQLARADEGFRGRDGFAVWMSAREGLRAGSRLSPRHDRLHVTILDPGRPDGFRRASYRRE